MSSETFNARRERYGNNHGVCVDLPKARQAVRNWRKTLDSELYRLERDPRFRGSRLPITTWDRIARVAATLAHYGRCVQIQKEEAR
jgi:hypothetical protein